MVNGTVLNFGKRYEVAKVALRLIDALSNQKILKGIYSGPT